LSIGHLSFHLRLEQEETEEGSFSSTFTLHIVNNVVINYYIFLQGAHAELFPPPSKLSGCDFKDWVDDYMTPKDIEYMTWVKRNEAAMSKGGSSSK
jgi:hypothetical protein